MQFDVEFSDSAWDEVLSKVKKMLKEGFAKDEIIYNLTLYDTDCWFIVSSFFFSGCNTDMYFSVSGTVEGVLREMAIFILEDVIDELEE